MFFSNPIYLWFLLGILIPVFIHLWSRKEGRTIKVGSIKLLQESKSKKSKSISFNEWWLLAMRISLISVLALILSGPFIKYKTIAEPIVYVIEPLLITDSKFASVMDTLPNVPIKLLAQDFPEYNVDALGYYGDKNLPYWQLAQEMESLKADSIVVFTKALLSGIKGMRPAVAQYINWIVFPTDSVQIQTVKGVEKSDSIEFVSMISDSEKLRFTKEIVSKNSDLLSFLNQDDIVRKMANKNRDTIKLLKQKQIKIVLNDKDTISDQVRYVEASLKTLSKYLDNPIEIVKTTSVRGVNFDEFDLVVCLDPENIPDMSTKLLIYQEDIFAEKLIEKGSDFSIFYLRKKLNPSTIIDQNFFHQLIEVLGFNKDVEVKISKYDTRVLDVAQFLPMQSLTEQHDKKKDVLNISKWLWLGFIIILIAERIVAKYRKQ